MTAAPRFPDAPAIRTANKTQRYEIHSITQESCARASNDSARKQAAENCLSSGHDVDRIYIASRNENADHRAPRKFCILTPPCLGVLRKISVLGAVGTLYTGASSLRSANDLRLGVTPLTLDPCCRQSVAEDKQRLTHELTAVAGFIRTIYCSPQAGSRRLGSGSDLFCCILFVIPGVRSTNI